MKEIYKSYKFRIYPNEVIDRDVNAAKNILAEGLRNISVGHTDYTDGDRIRLDNEHQSMKSGRSPRF